MAEAMHYGKTSFPVELPPELIAAELEPNAVELEQKPVPELVRDALAHPIDSKPLKELVKPGESVCIIISDVTRRWQSPETYIPIVVEELESAGHPGRGHPHPLRHGHPPPPDPRGAHGPCDGGRIPPHPGGGPRVHRRG